MTEEELRPHPQFKGPIVGWGDIRCDYCDYAADMAYKGGHACLDHRTTLLKDKDRESRVT